MMEMQLLPASINYDVIFMYLTRQCILTLILYIMHHLGPGLEEGRAPEVTVWP